MHNAKMMMSGSWLALAAAGVLVASCGGDTEIKYRAASAVVVTAGSNAIEVGASVAFNATTEGEEGLTDASYAWASSDDMVATVGDDGTVTGVAVGEAIITATGADTALSGSLAIVVRRAAVTPGTPSIAVQGEFVLEVAATTTLTAATTDGTDASYTWATSDAMVATVDDTGLVTGVATGEVIISATGADTGAVGQIGMVVMPIPVDPFEPPFFAAWAGSGHADGEAEAFVHWDEDGEVSESCARCHSSGGYQDYLGADGTEAFVVDGPAAIGTTVDCNACHNAATQNLDKVIFPSGVEVTGLGVEARCITCHQGRASTVSLDEAIATAAPADDDTVSADLSFLNVHYYAAGATLFGGVAKGGYQYADMHYDVRNRHVDGKATCQECHNVHTLEVKLDECAVCHTEATTLEGLADIRMFGSVGDYDGDGNVDEGMKAELEGLSTTLYAAIQAYATEDAGASIVYDSHAYPYFFTDTNADGVADADEVNYGNRYATWTARLVRAAYNYQYAAKDPGAYAHNPKYVVQLLSDSINDLNTALSTPVAFAGERFDGPHFRGSNEAFRHWDEDGEIAASCSKCHSGEGAKFYWEHGVSAPMEPANGLACVTCHQSFDDLALLTEVSSVTFPSGVTLDAGEGASNAANANITNMCATCHSGREAGATVDAAIAEGELGFKNVHYRSAAGTLFGSDAAVGYEYAGNTYDGRWTHTGGNDCVNCHNPKGTRHSFAVADNFAACTVCHTGATTTADLRLASTDDYDGDADTAEGLEGEVETLAALLYTQIQTYATALGTGVVYGPGSYPYFFIDTNSNGTPDADETNYGNRYVAFDATLLQAAFNYQYSQVEPGAWAHNFAYVGQLLYDSIESLGGATAVTGLTRP